MDEEDEMGYQKYEWAFLVDKNEQEDVKVEEYSVYLYFPYVIYT